jgi:hypothetical protein
MYAGCGAAWILLSDALALSLAPNAEWLATAQRHKGIVFVAMTSVALVWLVRSGRSRLVGALVRAHHSVGVDGAVQLVDGIVEDVADTKRTEHALHDLNEQLEARMHAIAPTWQFLDTGHLALEGAGDWMTARWPGP